MDVGAGLPGPKPLKAAGEQAGLSVPYRMGDVRGRIHKLQSMNRTTGSYLWWASAEAGSTGMY